MRIAIIGQQDFGKAVLQAFLKRGDEVAADVGAGRVRQHTSVPARGGPPHL